MKSLKLFIPLVFLSFSYSSFSQQSLSLQQCYSSLERNYPLVKQKVLVDESGNIELKNINKKYLPDIDFAAQATWQSAVTQVSTPIPNLDIPHPNKDQYKATLTVNQIVYDGGITKASAKVQEAETAVKQQEIEVSLFQLKKLVNRYYFSILLLQENKIQLEVLRDNLETRYKEIQSAIKNGVVLPSSDDIIYVEMLKTDQQITALESDKVTMINLLSQLTGIAIDPDTQLEHPVVNFTSENVIVRPEMKTFELQKHQLDLTSNMVGKTNTPKVALFAQGGYANPGLNMLDNTFQPFFYGGVRLNWKLTDWNVSRNKQQNLFIQQEMIDVQKKTFELNTSLELIQIGNEIDKQDKLLLLDDEIITIRKKIVAVNESQMKNGTITTSQYLTEVVALSQAEITQQAHSIQLLLLQAEYNLTTGKTN